MKKTYVKPALIMEHFGFSQTIASGCGYRPSQHGSFGEPNHANKNVCGWKWGGMILFLDSKPNICSWGVPSRMDVEGICYDNPNGGVTIFGS